jgi:hypothetical protein
MFFVQPDSATRVKNALTPAIAQNILSLILICLLKMEWGLITPTPRSGG